MSRALIVLKHSSDREKVAKWAMTAPWGTRIEWKAPSRSIPQNKRLWAMLGDISAQKAHAGRKYSPETWKHLFMHALGREVQFVPALDGQTFIPIGQSSSDLSKVEMTDLIEFMFEWGARNDVKWSDPNEQAPKHGEAA